MRRRGETGSWTEARCRDGDTVHLHAVGVELEVRTIYDIAVRDGP